MAADIQELHDLFQLRLLFRESFLLPGKLQQLPPLLPGGALFLARRHALLRRSQALPQSLARSGFLVVPRRIALVLDLADRSFERVERLRLAATLIRRLPVEAGDLFHVADESVAQLGGRRRAAPVRLGTLLDLQRFLLEVLDLCLALDLRAVALIEAHILLQYAAELTHAVLLFVQLALDGIEEPLLDEPFLILAVREKLRQPRLLLVDLADDVLPFAIVNAVFHELREVLLRLRGAVHIVAQKLLLRLPAQRLEELPARGIALEPHLRARLLDDGQMMYVLRARRPVLAEEVDDLKRLARVDILAAAHHHARQQAAAALLQLPFDEDEGRLRRAEIAGERPVLHIAEAPLHEGRTEHLHEDGLAAAVLQGDQRALAVEVHRFVADADRVMVVIDIDQPHRADLAHRLPPPAP